MGAESTKPGPRGGAPEAFPTETPAQPSTPSTTNPSADGAQVVGARGYAPVFQGDVASGSGATPTTQPATFVPPPPLGREGTDIGLFSGSHSWQEAGADASIDDLMPPLRTGFGEDWLL
jgi:hypothetical protein